MSDVNGAYDLANEHAEMLATRWWTADEFRELGVPCREGPFTFGETELVKDAIRKYQTANGIGQEDVEDLVLGLSAQDGFWENIARGVPGRRVRSVNAHAKGLFDPHQDYKPWTGANDSRLMALVKQKLTWAEIGDAMLRSARACSNRYHNQLARRGTRREGNWTKEEVDTLDNIVQVMTNEGKEPAGPKSKFWKQVSARMDNTRTPEQCRTKWRYSLSPEAKNCSRIRWRETDTKTLVNKVVLLNVDTEEDVNWDAICWKTWSADKLRKRWADLKADAKVDTSMSHRDTVQQLRGRWGIAT